MNGDQRAWNTQQMKYSVQVGDELKMLRWILGN